jgi:hypothetical protein
MPCTQVLDEDACTLLTYLACPSGLPPDQPLNLQTAVRQIAKLGGFLGRTHDGAPGVKTLWRGLCRLNDMVLTYRMLREHPMHLADSPLITCV